MRAWFGGRRALRSCVGGAALVVAVALAAPATAQDTAQGATYSLDVYRALQERADASYALLTSLSEDAAGYGDLAASALADRQALVDYLASWVQSGTMPQEMLESAYETRIVLYQNIVVLQTGLGLCEEARGIAEEVETLVGEHETTELSSDAIHTTWVNVGRCWDAEGRAGESSDATDGDAADDTEAPDHADLTAETGASGDEEGEGAHVAAGPPELATSSSEPQTTQRTGGFQPGWVLVGTGGAMTLAGVYVGSVMLADTNRRIEEWNDGTSTMEAEAHAELGEQAERRRNAANVLTAVGLVTVVGGAAWTVLARGQGDSDPASARLWLPQGVAMTPLDGGGFLDVRWRW